MYTALLLLSVAPVVQDDPTALTAPLPRPSQALEFDGPVAPAPARTRVAGAPAWGGHETPPSLVAARAPQAKSAEGPAPTFSTPLDLRARLTEVLYQENLPGEVWARGRDYRASFGADGFDFYPVFGRVAPREFPVEFTLRRATVGGQELPVAVAGVARSGQSVTIARSALREVYHLDLDGVEQTFELDALPGAGDLVLDLAVGTELAVLDAADGLHFVHPDLGHVSYGDAFVLDAAGARAAISRTWTGEGIELRVPAEFLADAVLPITVDPRVTSFTNGFGTTDDDIRTDICWSGRTDRYWVVWEDYTSATNTDVYATTFDFAGAQGSTVSVDLTADQWVEPKIAYHYGADRLLVVASENPTGSGRIQGQLIDANASTLIGAEFTISSVGFPKINPDVGGNNWDSTTNSHFCVVWSFQAAAGNHDVQYRVVDWDGTFVTSITTVESSGDDTIQTAISETHGDGDLFGDWWTIAWTRDANADGLGSIEARRVVWSGVSTSGAGNFVVDSATSCAWPTVSSRLDDNLVAVADRPSLIVYERDFVGSYNPRQRSLYGRVVTDGQAFPSVGINLTLEDVDAELDQRDCHIATDGSAWYLVYSEVYYGSPSGTDYDEYYCSGHVSQTSSAAYLALAERHQNLGFSGSAERYGRVATRWDGESSSTSDDAAAVWNRLDGTNGGTLYGYTLEIPTIDVSANIASGRQFCDANVNGGPTTFGADNTWMWIEGSQSIGSTHIARAENVTPNALGYLIGSPTATSIYSPGTTMGHLCVAGGGRYVNNVQNSGTARTYATNITPTNIPSPTGFVSAVPGQTWYFQYWHRDNIGGVVTSNFSTACSIVFAP